MLELKPETKKFIEKYANERGITVDDVEKEIIEGYVNMYLNVNIQSQNQNMGIPSQNQEVVGNCFPSTGPLVKSVTSDMVDLFSKIDKATFEYDQRGIKVNISFKQIEKQENKTKNPSS